MRSWLEHAGGTWPADGLVFTTHTPVPAGIDPREAANLIGREGAQLDFALGNPELRPSTVDEDSVAAQGEVSR